MINSNDLTNKLAIDSNGLNDLKQASKDNSPEAIKGVAKQFEAIFMNMMLKSMREASPQDSPFDNDQSRTFTSMLDQQLSNNLASKGLGLADILARQLSNTDYATPSSLEQAVSNNPASAPTSNPNILKNLEHKAPSNVVQPATVNSLNDNSDFQNRMSQHAEEASRATGVPAHLMLGQAALESGWGKREIKGHDGTQSNNLFGIKATSDWNGKVVEATTTEYINGVKQKRIEKFRAYDSYADSFKDFANMMRNNPRYKKVMANLQNVTGYAQAMQKAGYATDPDYANKLANVIQKIST